MTPLRQRMIEDMQIRNLSPSTIKSYTYHVGCFAKYFNLSPEHLGPEQIRQYQIHLVREKKASWSTFNQTVCAVRFLYRHTLPRPWAVEMIPFGKRPKVLPAVLSCEEVQRLLECVKPIKQRTVFLTMYAAGLRLSEALHLRVTDIDSQRMQLLVAHGKGNKQRLSPISPRLLETLRHYWVEVRPESYLFPGKTNDRPLNSTVIQKGCKQAALQAGLKKRVTPHTLRHSYATGLLEAGVDLLTIGQLLGHRSFSSTLIYLHVRRPHLISTPSPLDWLPVEQCPQWTRPHAPPSNPATDHE
jgi:site-specific recombinase XerD